MDQIAPLVPRADLPAPPPIDADPVRVVVMPSLFREATKRRFATAAPGCSLLDLVLEHDMGELAPNADDPGAVTIRLPGKVEIEVGGHRIERCYWHLCRPKPGQLVNIFLVPQGQRAAIVIGASLAIAVAAVFTGGAAAAAGYPLLGALGAATVSIGGSYRLDAFLLVPRPAP